MSQSIPITAERFLEVIEIVKNRHRSPEDMERFRQDAEIHQVWGNYQYVLSKGNKEITERWHKVESDWRSQGNPFGTFTSTRDQDNFSHFRKGAQRAPMTPELAVFLGDLGYHMSLSKEDLMRSELGGEVTDWTEDKLGREQLLGRLYPLALAAKHAMEHLKRDRPSDLPALPVDASLDACENLEKLNEHLNPRKNVYAKKNVGSRGLARLAVGLTTPYALATEDLTEALHKATWERRFHIPTNYASNCMAAFPHSIGERVKKHGPPELLVLFGTGSNLATRELFAESEHTPNDAYTKFVWDNTQGTLDHGVDNVQCTDHILRAMVETGLAKQITAILRMRRRPVDITIRATAAKVGIKHPDVDKAEVFEFLRRNIFNTEEVPHALWVDLSIQLQGELKKAREDASDEALALLPEEEQQKRIDRLASVEAQVAKVTKAYMGEILKPYVEAKKNVEKFNELPEHQQRYMPWKRRQQIQADREFVRGHEFLTKAELLEMLFDGVKEEEEALALIEAVKELGVPPTKKMTVRVLKHPSQEVKTAGRGLVLRADDAALEKMQEEVDQKLEGEHGELQRRLDNLTIGFERVEGTPREQNRNKPPYYRAAHHLTAGEITQLFVECVENPNIGFKNMHVEFPAAAIGKKMERGIPLEGYERDLLVDAALDRQERGFALTAEEQAIIAEYEAEQAAKKAAKKANRSPSKRTNKTRNLRTADALEKLTSEGVTAADLTEGIEAPSEDIVMKVDDLVQPAETTDFFEKPVEQGTLFDMDSIPTKPKNGRNNNAQNL